MKAKTTITTKIDRKNGQMKSTTPTPTTIYSLGLAQICSIGSLGPNSALFPPTNVEELANKPGNEETLTLENNRKSGADGMKKQQQKQTIPRPRW